MNWRSEAVIRGVGRMGFLRNLAVRSVRNTFVNPNIPDFQVRERGVCSRACGSRVLGSSMSLSGGDNNMSIPDL